MGLTYVDAHSFALISKYYLRKMFIFFVLPNTWLSRATDRINRTSALNEMNGIQFLECCNAYFVHCNIA